MVRYCGNCCSVTRARNLNSIETRYADADNGCFFVFVAGRDERTNGRWWQSGRTDGRGEESRGEELR